MVLPEDEIDRYILDYLSFVIEDPQERAKMFSKSQAIIRRQNREFGVRGLEGVHETLEVILDQRGQRWNRSLDAALNDEGFNLHQVIPAAMPIKTLSDLDKGNKLLQLLQDTLPVYQFKSLVSMFGNIDNFAYLLGTSSLTSQDIAQGDRVYGNIAWMANQNEQSRIMYAEYDRFVKGNRVSNPIRHLDDLSMPVVRKVISDIYRLEGGISEAHLLRAGFSGLLRTMGTSDVLRNVHPELLHKIRGRNKWRRMGESVQIAIKSIEEVLYQIPGYEDAEKNMDRNSQVKIISDLIETEGQLKEYFHRGGLKALMNNLIDPTGTFGLKKMDSPKALLEFYSEKKSLNWFDRSQSTYVKRWRIREVNMWQRGESSIQLALEAISDALYSIPDYKKAEISGNRDWQVRIINDFISKEQRILDFFLDSGLGSLMACFIDPTGRNGLAKNSAKALLEFYSEKKSLNWFDRSQSSYVRSWRMPQTNMWQDDKSMNLALDAIQDVLRAIPGYRIAEETKDRQMQISIIYQLKRQTGLQAYFYREGLCGMMNNFYDPEGEIGIKKRGSPVAVLEFYSTKRGLGWFDQNKTAYLTSSKKGNLMLISKI